MKIEQQSAAMGPASIFYRVEGEGPPVILIHGLAASSRWWTRNIKHLARSHRVYALDLIGFGASRGHLPFNLEDGSGHLASWMDSLGIERASIIGHSMGGFIGASLAADFPEHVDRLMLVGAAALPLNRRYLWQTLGPVRGLLDLCFDSFTLLVSDALRAGPLTIWNAARTQQRRHHHQALHYPGAGTADLGRARRDHPAADRPTDRRDTAARGTGGHQERRTQRHVRPPGRVQSSSTGLLQRQIGERLALIAAATGIHCLTARL